LKNLMILSFIQNNPEVYLSGRSAKISLKLKG
jgi:hypothetical protein